MSDNEAIHEDTDFAAHGPGALGGTCSEALYTAAQVREMDRIAIEERGTSAYWLMVRAGYAAWRLVARRWQRASKIDLVSGPGNNGGDAWVLARLALKAGRRVCVYTVGKRPGTGAEASQARDEYLAEGGLERAFTGVLPINSDLLVDGLLGTGVDRPLQGDYLAAVQAMNATGLPILALDLPSGLHPDTGTVNTVAVRASCTLSFVAAKQGLYTAAGRELCGDVVVDHLGIAASVFCTQSAPAWLMDEQVASLPRRHADTHKGDFGDVLVVGGNAGMGGAALLAGRAALRSGAGRVHLCSRAATLDAALSRQPELMGRVIDRGADLTAIMAALSRNTGRQRVLAIGPGLGRDDWAGAVWAAALQGDWPLVVDADALGWLAENPGRRDDWVLTPHPGEAARLLGVTGADIQADRFAAVREIQSQYGGVCVLKGAGTLVCADSAAVFVCPTGNPAMASAGMGDVLTGMVAALVAQGLDLPEAAMAAVYRHGQLADVQVRCNQRRVVLASDVIAAL